MNITLISSPKSSVDATIVLYYKSDKQKDPRLTGGYLSANAVTTADGLEIWVGLGEKKESTPNRIAHAVGTGCRSVQTTAKTIQVDVNRYVSKQDGQFLAMGAIMGTYRFDTFKSKVEQTPTLNSIAIVAKDADKAAFKDGVVIGDAANAARDLSNTPSNVLTTSAFVEQIKTEFSAESGFNVTIIDEKDAAKLGMNALLCVGQGSASPTYLAAIEYVGDTSSKDKIALVGKGIVFDTGGISLKPSAKMRDMKGDMSGAAAVFGAMKALKSLKPKTNCLAVIPLAENMPSSTAQRPGDVVTASNGTTIEIVNTDAEGRLILADALVYAVKNGATKIADIATLTGACVVAFGFEALAILGNDQKWIDQTKKLEDKTGERIWQLPLYEEYKEYLKSDVADIMHCSEQRGGGTCTAAKFLEQFVDGTPWIHFDMAPRMDHSKTKGYEIKGMAGSGVRTLVKLVTG